jgi:hypothetical protein
LPPNVVLRSTVALMKVAPAMVAANQARPAQPAGA